MITAANRSTTTMTVSEACDRLGVKAPTLYAYVSRGVLRRARGSTARRTLLDAVEVERLARRGRPRRSSRPFLFEVEIETSLTEIDDHRIRFRGHDAATLARTVAFEQAATLMWTGDLPAAIPAWRGPTFDTSAGHDLVDRLRLSVTLAALADPLRGDLEPAAVASCGASLIAAVVDSLPVVGDGRAPRLTLPGLTTPARGTVAGRLWARTTAARPKPELVVALNAALVLLIDHELATSTFAARLAASTRADPYAVVAAGLGPVSGPLHGGASRVARDLLDDAHQRGAPAALAEALRRDRRLPGFGHFLYPDGDPRAGVLLGLLREAARGTRTLDTVESVLEVVRQRTPVHPNVDFGLAALTFVAGMPPETGELVFSTARVVGWLAHALEEYRATPLRFRPRARFVPAGPEPGRA